MSTKKVYAVAKGRKPGIYDEWFGAKGAEIQIKGFAGARYKGFPSHSEGKAWLDAMSAGGSGNGKRMQSVSVAKKTRHEEPTSRQTKDNHPGEMENAVIMYSDGGCKNNPGPGGYGVVILEGGGRRELSGGYALTTNNRMELTGCIKGLEAIGNQRSVILHTDSQYVVNGIEKGWAKRWRKNNWMRNRTDRAENSDLWSRLLDLCDLHDVRFVWVRGHNGDRENERCDELAVAMTHRTELPVDNGFSR